MDRFQLMSGRSGLAVGPEVVGFKWPGVSQVGIQGHEQRRALLYDPHSGVTVAVNATLMPLRLAKPTLQVQVVTRQARLVTADEQARLEAPHRRRHLAPHRVRFGPQAIANRLEEGTAFMARAARRIEGGGDLDDLAHTLPDRDLGLLDRIQSPVDEPGQATQERLGSPPFFAPRFRPMDRLTSPNASAIRKPGGWSGPPWSSLRMPRTAQQ
jgi:hypothetical protein